MSEPRSIPDLVVERVGREGMKLACALMRDPAPLHWDDEEVRRLGLGEKALNPGAISAAWVARLVGRWAGGYGEVQRVKLRFLGRVHADDRVVVSGRRAAGDHDGGTVRLEVALRRETADGPELVLEGEAWVTARPGGS